MVALSIRRGSSTLKASCLLLLRRFYRFESDQVRTDLAVSKIREEVARLLASETREDAHVYSTLLLKCGSFKLVQEGELLHAKVSGLWQNRLERLLLNCLVEMYGKCGSLEKAKAVFASIQIPNVFSWAIVIAAHAQNGHYREALRLFQRMELEGIKANSVTYVNVIGACSGLSECRKLRARVAEAGLGQDLVVVTALLTVFGKVGGLEDAREIFESMSEKDVVAWNALIAAYSQQGQSQECLSLFKRMLLDKRLTPDEVTYICVIDACADLRDLDLSRGIHTRILEAGLESDSLMSALVDMYGKCGMCEDSKEVFDRMKRRQASTWNALISAYAQRGYMLEALRLLQEMDLEGVRATDITFISLLQGFSLNFCSRRAAEGLRTRVTESGYLSDVWVATSLLTMYGRSGLADEARAVFDGMDLRNLVTFNAMIGAYAEVCRVEEALEVLWMMEQGGVSPDSVTLLSVLFSCSHSGLLEEGLRRFRSMSERGLRAGVDHYRCVVDLMARAGWICEAEEVIQGRFEGLDDLPAVSSLLSASLR